MLGLADLPSTPRMLERATNADVLAYALVLPGAADPVEGIVDAVRVELTALAPMLQERGAGDVLQLLARRLETAMVLLRRADSREPTPPEDGADPSASPPDGSTMPAPDAVEDLPTQDAPPRR